MNPRKSSSTVYDRPVETGSGRSSRCPLARFSERSHMPRTDGLEVPAGTYINPLPIGIEIPMMMYSCTGCLTKPTMVDSDLRELAASLRVPLGVFSATLRTADGDRPMTIITPWPHKKNRPVIAFGTDGRPSVYGNIHIADGHPRDPTGATNLKEIIGDNLVGLMGRDSKGEFTSYYAVRDLDVHWYEVMA